MKTDLFQFCGHCWVFQICWHIECSTFTASSFRIWNSSAGIPSPSLALFVVMLPKAHLTSHSRMSGSRWVITPSWLSGSLRSFLYSSSMYSCRLFLRWWTMQMITFHHYDAGIMQVITLPPVFHLCSMLPIIRILNNIVFLWSPSVPTYWRYRVKFCSLIGSH